MDYREFIAAAKAAAKRLWKRFTDQPLPVQLMLLGVAATAAPILGSSVAVTVAGVTVTIGVGAFVYLLIFRDWWDDE